MTTRSNPTPRAELDRDNDRITVAVTFSWRRPWALDKCEAGALPRDLTRALLYAAEPGGPLADWAECQLDKIESIRTWDPAEEVELAIYPRVELHREPQ